VLGIRQRAQQRLHVRHLVDVELGGTRTLGDASREQLALSHRGVGGRVPKYFLHSLSEQHSTAAVGSIQETHYIKLCKKSFHIPNASTKILTKTTTTTPQNPTKHDAYWQTHTSIILSSDSSSPITSTKPGRRPPRTPITFCSNGCTNNPYNTIAAKQIN
jgi:hypothetical protein